MRSRLISRLLEQIYAVLRQHKSAIRESFRHLLTTPIGNLLTLMAIALALALPGGLYFAANSLKTATEAWDARQINAYMPITMADDKLETIATELKENPDIAEIEIITREQSLENFRDSSGLSNVLDLMEENPLPAVLVVQPADTLNDKDSIKQLAQTIEANHNIDKVQLDDDWLQKVFTIITSLERFTLIIAILFASIVILVINTALRLEILKHQREIKVIKLIGGSDAFIQRPFLYSAFLLGLSGALLALLVLQMIFASLSGHLADVAQYYGEVPPLQINAMFAGILIFVSVSLSLLAAYSAIKVLLWRIKP